VAVAADGRGSTSSAVPAAAGLLAPCDSSARCLAWLSSQEDAAQQLGQLLRELDVEDCRQQLVPANPTARVGAKYTLRKSSRHFSRIHRKRLQRHLSLKEVAW